MYLLYDVTIFDATPTDVKSCLKRYQYTLFSVEFTQACDGSHNTTVFEQQPFPQSKNFFAENG